MFKNVDKLLFRTIYTYFIVLIIVFIMKICGLDYFGLDLNNKIILGINNFVQKYNLELIWYGITLYIYTYIILAITCNDKSKKMKLYTLMIFPLCVGIQWIKQNVNLPMIFVFTDLLWLFTVSICYIKFVNKDKIQKINISNYFIYCGLNVLFQSLSIVIRDVSFTNENNFITYLILNLDYLMLSIITYKLYFLKGGISLWAEVVGLYSHLQLLLKSLPIKLQNIYTTNKSKNKFDKISDIIYLPLFILWNILTVVGILLIGFLNETFVECIIILFSFWINKKVFGKPFHMKTAISCFVFSNIMYYCLNRITISSGLSLLISITLGILLDYFTSYFVHDKKLYRGMSQDLLDTLISNVVDKDSDEYKICKMFYVDKQSDQYIARKLNYSKSSIEKKKHNIIAKLQKS